MNKLIKMEATALKKLALNEVHKALGARMMPFAGYNMPVSYTSVIEEHHTVREKVGIFDVSHMGEFILEGPEALNLIQKISSNDAAKLTDGQAQYTCMPNDQGGIVDDLLIYRINEEKYMLVVNASNIKKDWSWIEKHNSWGVSLKNISDDTSLFAVQGPKATAVLQSLTPVDLAQIQYYTFVIGEFAGVPDIIISATGYTGSGGFELYIPNKEAQSLWHQIIKAGETSGIQPIGLAARDTLRLEMGYCLYGNDIDDHTSPLEAGLGWITKFNKDFINAENLLQQKEEGIKRKLVGFQMLEKGIPRTGYDIYDAQSEKIGHVTSGTSSPSLGMGIGLGYIKKPHTKSDTEIFIGIRNKKVKARVAKLPFYKANT